MTFTLETVGHIDNQDAVFADQSHQRDDADERVDVQRRAAKLHHLRIKHVQSTDDMNRRHGACNRHRDGNHDDQRCAEALEKRCEREENDDGRKQQQRDEAAGFLHILAGSTRVVDDVTCRQRARRDLLHKRQRTALCQTHPDLRIDCRRIQLLEMGQRFRRRAAADMRNRRELHETAVRCADVIIQQL